MSLITRRLAFVICLVTASVAIAQAEKPPTQILFENVNVFNGTDNKIFEGLYVLVEGNLIKAISSKPIKTRNGAIVIDGGGAKLKSYCRRGRNCGDKEPRRRNPG